MSNAAAISRFIHPAEWASRLGVHKNTVFRMVEAGDIPKPARLTAHKIGWPEETFQRWAAERCQAVAA